MALLIPSFLAGILTIFAPCVLSLLPIIIGGSLTDKNPRRPLIIVGSLAVSVIVFTLLLKGTTAFISIPTAFWAYFSGTLITFFSLSLLFPDTWSLLAFKLGLYKSEQLLEQDETTKSSTKGAILLGASLGPVFTTCSPTYFLILAIVLPISFSMALLDLTVYAIGMSIPLLLIGYGGQTIAAKFRVFANPTGTFKKTLGLILLITGILILTGTDKKLEAWLIQKGYTGFSQFEESLIKDK